MNMKLLLGYYCCFIYLLCSVVVNSEATESSTTNAVAPVNARMEADSSNSSSLVEEAAEVVEAANSIYNDSLETMTFPSYEDWKTFLEGNWTYCPIMSGLQYTSSYKMCQMIRFTCGNQTESVAFFNNCGCGCYQKNCVVGGDNNAEECNMNTTPKYPSSSSSIGGEEAKSYYGLNVIINGTTSDNSNNYDAMFMQNAKMGTGSSSSSSSSNTINNNGNGNNFDGDNINDIECNYDDTSSSFRDVYNSYTYGIRVTIDRSASSSTEATSLYACIGNEHDMHATTTATNTMLDTNNNDNNNMVAIQSRGMKPSMYATGYYKVDVLEVYNSNDDDEEMLLFSMLNDDNNSLILFYENENGNYRKEWDLISTSPNDNNDDSFIIFPMPVPESKNCIVNGNNNMVYIDRCSEGFRYSSLSQDDIDYLTTQNKRVTVSDSYNKNNSGSGSGSSIALPCYHGMMMIMMTMMICVIV